MHRAVLDLNVVVSALIEGRGPSAQLLEAVLEGRLTLIACPRWFTELGAVLARPKFASRFTPAQAGAVLDALHAVAELSGDPVGVLATTRDPGDDYLVALALGQGCEAIVSGDQDLRSQSLVPVASAREALGLIDAG